MHKTLTSAQRHHSGQLDELTLRREASPSQHEFCNWASLEYAQLSRHRLEGTIAFYPVPPSQGEVQQRRQEEAQQQQLPQEEIRQHRPWVRALIMIMSPLANQNAQKSSQTTAPLWLDWLKSIILHT